MSGNGENQDDGGTDDRETLLRKERASGLPAQQIFSIFFNQLYQVLVLQCCDDLESFRMKACAF